MFESKLILILLVAIVPSHCSDNEPLEDQLDELLEQLQNATDDYQCIFEVADNQCPCLTSDGVCLVGNETIDDVECFEHKLEVLKNILHDLIDDLTNLTSDRPADCPILDGCAALVSGCESGNIAVVDGAGTILPDIVVNGNITSLAVSDDDDCYTTYLLVDRFDGLVRHNVIGVIETGAEVSFGSVSSTRTAIAYGDGVIAYSIGGNVIATNAQMMFLFSESLTDDQGIVRVYGSRVYFVVGNEIKSVNATGDDLQEELKFPLGITSFDVLDEERLVFGDPAGGLWVYNRTSECFKLVDCGQASADVKVNPCFDQFYVVYPDDAELTRWSSTTCEQDDSLTYTLSSPSACPRLAFEPNCARPNDGNLFPQAGESTTPTKP